MRGADRGDQARDAHDDEHRRTGTPDQRLVLAQRAADGCADGDRHHRVREVHGRDAARRPDRHPHPVDQAGAQQEHADGSDRHGDRQTGQHAEQQG